jgi:hypothetical protein
VTTVLQYAAFLALFFLPGLSAAFVAATAAVGALAAMHYFSWLRGSERRAG